MDDRGDRRSEQTAARDDERAQRLAAALRKNLLRRKRQASARSRESEGDRPAESAAEAAETPHDSAEIVPDKKTG
jgi:hypothetical protein